MKKLLIVLFAFGCAHHPTYPLTGHGVSFNDLDATQAHAAPNVAARVDFARIRNARAAEPQNWLTYYGAYDGQRYSPLDEINRGNVKALRPAWVFQAGVIGLIANPPTYALEAAPIVVDGVMYLSGWDGYVWALDATNGHVLWRYRHAIPLDVPLCCGNVNRGVAVARGRVYATTPNGHLIALDATNGHLAWDVAAVDPRAGESLTVAPLVVKNMAIIGSSGGEYGVRGHIDAYDLDTGRHLWRHYNVPKPGEPGSESWGGERDSWARGGGTAWVTGTYDPELDTLYWSTGNPGPDFDGSVRPGDNLYTDSVVALDPNSGARKWHYQWTPHDVWDYDGISENILFDHDGRKYLAHFDKNGYLFVLDRTNGRFVHAARYGRATWGDVDPNSGRVTVRLTPTEQGTEICPGPAGLKEWTHAAYSRETGLLYVPTIETCGTFKLIPNRFNESLPYWGGDVDVKSHDQYGMVKAFDPLSGREVWSWRGPHPMVSSLLTTAGGVVFGGEPNGNFDAWDAKTGELLFTFNTGSGIHSNPVTYAVGGKQYVAVPTGWGGWMKGFAPETYGATRGSALMVFALP